MVSMGQQELHAMVSELSRQVRSAVRPMLGSERAKGFAGQGASGDATFGIDEVAEQVAEDFLGRRGNIASYTEDRGLVVRGDADLVLVIDPIDGTRPAAAGLESCCISVAAAPFEKDRAHLLTLGDVFFGMVTEIKNQVVFSAFKGGGARIESQGALTKPPASRSTGIDSMFWTLGFRGRPAEPLITVLSGLVDASSVGGGCFDLGSATFGITRVVMGEMDVYVDVGQRMADENALVRRMFLELGRGAILNNYPYDVAAAALIAAEAGMVVTDALGKPLDGYALIPSGGGGQVSAVVSSNPGLHRQVIDELDRGMARLNRRYR